MNNNFIKSQNLFLNLLGEFNDHKLYGKLISIKGTEAISELFHYKLSLLTTSSEIISKPLCGKDISFSVSSKSEEKQTIERYFHGIINKVTFIKRHNQTNSANPTFEYCLEILPTLATLNMVKASRVFYAATQKLNEVIEQILKQHNINYEINIKNKELLEAENCIQYNESDYEFVSRLLSAAGLIYFFKHTSNKHILVITDRPNSYIDFFDKSVNYISNLNESPGIYSISFQYENHISNYQTQAFSYIKKEEIQQGVYSHNSHELKQPQTMKSIENIYAYKIGNINQITQLATSSGLKDQSLCNIIQGESSYPSFSAGLKFSLAGKFFEHISPTDYVIVKLDFVIEINSDVVQCTNQFIATTIDKIYLPKKNVVKPTIHGLHYAIVVGSKGEIDSQEPYCDGNGRAYVKFLWDKDTNICKAHIISNSNGFTLPRIGAIVYILFPNNDSYHDIPVIVGINNEGLLDFNVNEDWYKNILMTYPESSDRKLYNFIYFKDKKDEQEIKLLARKDMFFEVENNEVINIKNDSSHTIKNVRKIIVEEGNNILEVNKGDIIIKVENGTYNINCKGKVTISAEDEIFLDAKSNLKIKSGGKIDIESSNGINLKTKGDTVIDASNINLNSSRAISNKAGTTSKYEAGTTLNIKSNVKTSIEGTMTEIKGKANIKINAPLTNISM